LNRGERLEKRMKNKESGAQKAPLLNLSWAEGSPVDEPITLRARMTFAVITEIGA
jgi:hypothetical protein